MNKLLLLILVVCLNVNALPPSNILRNKSYNTLRFPLTFPGPNTLMDTSGAVARYLWMDTDLPIGAVSNWIDRIQSVNAYQTEPLKYPTNTTTGVAFDGATTSANADWLLITNGGITLAPQYTIWIYWQFDGTGNAFQSLINATNAARGLFYVPTAGFGYEFFSPGAFVSGQNYLSAGNRTDVAIVSQATTLQFYTNGLAMTNTVTAPTITYQEIGASSTNSGFQNGLKGRIRTIAIWTNVVGSSNITALHTWATNNFGSTP